MIGLKRPARNQGLCTVITRFGNEEFQFTCFVPAKSEPSQVITFDQQTWSAQNLRQTGQRFNWRRQMCKTYTRNIPHLLSHSHIALSRESYPTRCYAATAVF